ncbi:MAG: cation:proton antiporter [Kiritimatiellia bacterium]
MAVVGVVTLVFTRLRWPKVIGYLFAGILMSEHTWGGSFLADGKSIGTIGQIGIVFLMFTLGLEFSAGDMKKVKHVAVPTALFDTVVMIWLGYTVGRYCLDWGAVPSLFLGAAICDSATTLLAKTVEEMKWQKRPFVRFIFGTTICEDILCVAVIALITGVVHGNGMSAGAVGFSLGGLAVFFTGVLGFGLVLVPRLLNSVARFKDDEALLLTLLGCCFFVSFLAFKFDYSLAMGAFLVGILGASSDVRERLYELAAPLRNMFAAVFFVTIGLLVDPAACWRHLPAILGLTFLVLLGKGINCFTMSLLTGQRIKDAVQTGFGLAQIGEFAYMVALMYITLTGDRENPMYQIVVGVSLITTCLNPFMLKISDPIGNWLEFHLPARLQGWIAAYGDWLMRFRTAVVPSQVQKHLNARLLWLAVLAALNFCVGAAVTILNDLDYTKFSVFFDAHKRLFFCLAANFVFLSLLVPVTGFAQSMGRDIGQILTGGTQRVRKWQKSVRQLVTWAVMMVVLVLFFAEIVMLNVNLMPDDLVARIGVLVVLVLMGVMGWKRFRRMGRAAVYHFQKALAAEARRANRQHRPTTVNLAVPGDFYVQLPLSSRSPAIGKTIKALDIRAKTGASIVAVARGPDRFRNPGPNWRFAVGDVAVAIGEPPQIQALRKLLEEDGPAL